MATKAVAKSSAITTKKRLAKSSKKAVKTAVKATVKKQPRDAASSGGMLTHRLDSLLHTMRTIAQHEDELCTLLHDARRSGKVDRNLLRELRTILEEMPAEEYADDLHAVRAIADERTR